MRNKIIKKDYCTISASFLSGGSSEAEGRICCNVSGLSIHGKFTIVDSLCLYYSSCLHGACLQIAFAIFSWTRMFVVFKQKTEEDRSDLRELLVIGRGDRRH